MTKRNALIQPAPMATHDEKAAGKPADYVVFYRRVSPNASNRTRFDVMWKGNISGKPTQQSITRTTHALHRELGEQIAVIEIQARQR